MYQIPVMGTPPFSTLGRHHGSTTKSCSVFWRIYVFFGSERKMGKLRENWTHFIRKACWILGFINFDVKKPGAADSELQMATLCLIRKYCCWRMMLISPSFWGICGWCWAFKLGKCFKQKNNKTLTEKEHILAIFHCRICKNKLH